jgi:uncharacterized protein DUF4136
VTRAIAAMLAAAALAGCASLNNVESDVWSFSRWPAGRSPSTYAFERLPSQQANPQQAQMLEDSARRAIESAGFAPAPEGSPPDVTIQLGARITAYEVAPWDDPFWYGGRYAWGPYGYWGRPWGPRWGPYAGPYWGPYWRYGYPYPTTTIEREVAVLIRDKKSGEPLYEARAQSGGNWAGGAVVLPAMFFAAMRDFPAGSATNPHRVVVAPPPQ